jgi:uncharacterized protein (TIGR02145 family)
VAVRSVTICPAPGEKNSRYTINSSSGGFDPVGDADKFYYPISGAPVRFVAYYPYSGDVVASGNTLTFNFAAQGEQALKESKDFLFHRGETNHSKSSDGIALSFRHKFSKILMTVKKGDGGPSLTDLTVELANLPKTATVYLDSLAQGKADSIVVAEEDNVAVIAPFVTVADGNESATVEAIVAPHAGGDTSVFSSRTFTFTAGDNDYIYELDDAVNFESGKVYAFTFTLESSGVTQTSDGMTNCFMVKPGNKLEFPVSRAYTYNGTNFTTTLHATDKNYTGEFTTEVVWADVAGLIETPTMIPDLVGNKAKVSIQTNSDKEGNAVVAIRKATDGKEIVWSWHIWVTDYDPDNGGATYENTYNTNNKGKRFVFMDRNLGATKASLGSGLGTGLFYQWGRKDPFPATGEKPSNFSGGSGSWSTAATSSSNGTVVNTIKNPGTFFWGVSGSSYDWFYGTTRNNELWGHSVDHSKPKTIYDPCPAGWRVPINSGYSENTSPWYGFAKAGTTIPDNILTAWNSSSGNEGYSWKAANAQYPAAGYRNSGSGALNATGTRGLYWSASPYSSSSDYASSLAFLSCTVNVSGNSNRAFGFSVRCVKE